MELMDQIYTIPVFDSTSATLVNVIYQSSILNHKHHSFVTSQDVLTLNLAWYATVPDLHAAMWLKTSTADHVTLGFEVHSVEAMKTSHYSEEHSETIGRHSTLFHLATSG